MISLAGSISCPHRDERCLQSFEWRKLTIIFHKCTLSLNESIGYVELADSNEIWPEHSQNIKEQKFVRNFLYNFGYFAYGGHERNRVGKLFLPILQSATMMKFASFLL